MRPRVVSGMRPTGELHLGHYHGALRNWVRLQPSTTASSSSPTGTRSPPTTQDRDVIERNVDDMVADWIAAGLDPELCTLFLQSRLPEHAELFTLLAMVTPMGWLERVPTYKEQRRTSTTATWPPTAFWATRCCRRPTSDLQGRLVPVGEDQVAHLELTREVVRRFNTSTAATARADWPLLHEPQALHTEVTKLPGLDGRKMSKSYGNDIAMREAPAQVEAKIRTMPTDPQRVRRTDPGDPARCPVWQFHLVYSDAATRQWVQDGCTTAGIGCLDCKQPVIEAIVREQAPWRERAEQLLANPKQVHWIVEMGTERARTVARQTMKDVRDVMGLAY